MIRKFAFIGLLVGLFAGFSSAPPAVAIPPKTLVPGMELTAPLQLIDTPPGHSAFPSLVFYPGRTVALAYRQGSDHYAARDGRLLLATSLDYGVSYTDTVTIEQTDGVDYRDPSLSTAGDELWTTWFTGSAENSAEGAWVRRGDRPPVRIDQDLPYAAIAAPVRQLPNGDLGAVYYGHAEGEQFDSVYFAWSPDGGDTWTSTRIADGEAAGRHYQEPWLMVRGSELIVTHRFGSWSAVGLTRSTDGGMSFSAPMQVLSSATGRPNGTVLASGTIALTYRHTTTHAAMLATSGDGGVTWRSRTLMAAPPGPIGMTYTDMLEVLPGVLHVVVGMEQSDGSSRLYGGWLAERQGF